MSFDPEGVVSFAVGRKTYRLFFGMRAMKEIERHYDKPFMRAIQSAMPQLAVEDLADKAKIAEASADIRLGDVAKLFEFGLIKHQPDTTEAEADELIDRIGIAKASKLLGEALAASIGSGEGDGEATENPPRKPSRASKTG